MRLPFLQLESDLIAHGAAEVAQLAGCHVAQALGHLALLRAWAVSHAGDDAPPDGWVSGDAAGRRIEAAAQWGGERGALLQALLDAGQVQQESGGLRVLHLEPYIIAWNKNAKAKERMRTARERSANTGERGAKFGQQTQTQTQTQTQKETTASQAPSAPLGDELPEAEAEEPLLPAEAVEARVESMLTERPPLELHAQEAKRGRPPQPGLVLYERLEASRADECKRLEVAFVPSRWPFARQNKELGPIARLPDDHEDKARFEAAWAAYCEDPLALTREPPFSLDFFWRMRSRYEGRAVQVAGGAS